MLDTVNTTELLESCICHLTAHHKKKKKRSKKKGKKKSSRYISVVQGGEGCQDNTSDEKRLYIWTDNGQ